MLKISALLTALAVVPAVPVVEWLTTSFSAALETARASQRMVLVYCWADGSDYCGKLYQETLAVDETAPALGKFVCYSAKHGQDGAKELFERYAVKTLPTLVFVNADGQAEDLIQGFIPPGELVGELDRIRSGKDTVSGMRAELAGAPAASETAMNTRWKLAGKVQALGDEKTHDALMDAIRERDPHGNTLTGARVRLGDLQRALAGDGDSDEGEQKDRSSWDLDPFYAFAKGVTVREARFEAWERIGNLEAAKQNLPAACKAFALAWKNVPDERHNDWGQGVARWIMEKPDQFTSKDRKFALELAQACVKDVKSRIAELGDAVEGEQRAYYARALNTLAWAYHHNGKRKLAANTGRQSLELHDDDYLRSDQKVFEGGD